MGPFVSADTQPGDIMVSSFLTASGLICSALLEKRNKHENSCAIRSGRS